MTIEIKTTQKGYLELLKITKDLPFFDIETKKSDSKERILQIRILGVSTNPERVEMTLKTFIEKTVNPAV